MTEKRDESRDIWVARNGRWGWLRETTPVAREYAPENVSRYVPASDLEAALARVRELESELSAARSQGQRIEHGMLIRDLSERDS